METKKGMRILYKRLFETDLTNGFLSLCSISTAASRQFEANFIALDLHVLSIDAISTRPVLIRTGLVGYKNRKKCRKFQIFRQKNEERKGKHHQIFDFWSYYVTTQQKKQTFFCICCSKI